MNSQRNTGAHIAPGLPARIRHSWDRDSHLSLSRRIRKGLRFLAQLLRARGELESCDAVGSSARVAGRLHIDNRGFISVGHHLNVNSSWVPIELVAGADGRIEIGDDVLINFGTMIAAGRSVTIGSGSMIGPHCIISDVDIPEAIGAGGPYTAAPIEIGKNVWLAGRVTVRPGVKIGDGAVVVAGSIVESDIPANFMGSGIPARAMPRLGPAVPPPHKTRELPARTSARAIPRLRGVLMSDFSLEDLVDELQAADPSPPLDAVLPAGADLAKKLTTATAGADDFAVIWTRPEAAVPSFQRLLAGESIDDGTLLADVDAFYRLVEVSAGNHRYILLPTWTLPVHVRGRGFNDARPGGVAAALATMNGRLMRAAAARKNVFVLDAARWQAAVGPSAFNARGWYLGGMAMARPLIVEAAREIRAALAALTARQRTLLVLRAEDVRWQAGRVHGTTSAPMAQAQTAFLRALSSLRQRGVRLALVGNAPQAQLRDAARALPDAILGDGDFAAYATIDADECGPLERLALDLGASLDAVVYVDARDVARVRVRSALTEVYVPEWPADKLLYPSALLALRCFDGNDGSAGERHTA